MKKIWVAGIIVLALAAIFIGFISYFCQDDWCFLFPWQKIRAADSFERCSSLGFPVTESYPRQCRAGDKFFTETVIRVTAPLPSALVQSPLTVRGEARGYWYFEASFPVLLFDSKGNQLAAIPAQAKSDWMTTDFVPFEAVFSFGAPTTETGTLVLKKDNPSGLPENEDSISIPVRFTKNGGEEQSVNFSKTGNIARDNPGLKPGVWFLTYEEPGAAALSIELSFDEMSECSLAGVGEPLCPSPTLKNGDHVKIEAFRQNSVAIVKKLEREGPAQTVKLYYYDPKKDQDASGNIQCSRQGLVSVFRRIPVTQTPIQDTIRFLIAGALTPQESVQGITTQYPLEGLVLKSASLKSGALTLTFDDPMNRTGGGACRVSILWFQIEATAKQFSGVNQVGFSPEELFQP